MGVVRGSLNTINASNGVSHLPKDVTKNFSVPIDSLILEDFNGD